MAQATKIRKNILGTISFTAKFKGMRKPLVNELESLGYILTIMNKDK